MAFDSSVIRKCDRAGSANHGPGEGAARAPPPRYLDFQVTKNGHLEVESPCYGAGLGCSPNPLAGLIFSEKK